MVMHDVETEMVNFFSSAYLHFFQVPHQASVSEDYRWKSYFLSRCKVLEMKSI